jgi:hypothetical protein
MDMFVFTSRKEHLFGDGKASVRTKSVERSDWWENRSAGCSLNSSSFQAQATSRALTQSYGLQYLEGLEGGGGEGGGGGQVDREEYREYNII